MVDREFASLTPATGAAYRRRGSIHHRALSDLTFASAPIACAPLRLLCADRVASSHAGLRFRRRRLLPVLMMSWAPPSSFDGRLHSFAGVGVGVGSRWQKCHRITPPTRGLPPWASLRLAPGSRPHAYRQALEATLAAIAPKKFRILQGRKRHGRTLKCFWGHGLIFGLPSEQKKS